VGSHLDVTRVRQRRKAPDLHLLPTLPPVGATKQAHTGRQEHSARPRCTNAQGMGVHHPLDFRIASNPALEMLLFNELEQLLGAVAPGLAPVQAPNDASDFDPSVEIIRLTGVSCEANDAAGKPHANHPCRLDDREALPALPAVVAAIDGGGRRAQVENLRVLRVKEYGPHNQPRVWEIQPFPMVTTVRAAIGAGLGARIDGLRVVGMDGEGPHLSALRKPAAERTPLVFAYPLPEESPRLRCVASATPGRRAGIDILGHSLLLL